VSIIPIKLTSHVSGSIPVTSRPNLESTLQPQVIFHRQGDQTLVMSGANFEIEPRGFIRDSRMTFSLGLWYRGLIGTSYRDATMAYIGTETVNWKFGYSYDLTFSQLTPGTGGAHELNFTIYFPTAIRKRFFCPDCDWHILNTDPWQGGGEQRMGRFGDRSKWWNGQRVKRSKQIGY